VDAKRAADFGHFVERRADVFEIADARRGICRRARRVEFYSFDQSGCMSRSEVFGIRILGQVEGHEGFEVRAFGHGGEDAVTIGACLCGRDDWRHEIWHDDRPAKVAGGFWKNGIEHRSITKMQVPIIGAGNRQALGHAPAITRMLTLVPVKTLFCGDRWEIRQLNALGQQIVQPFAEQWAVCATNDRATEESG